VTRQAGSRFGSRHSSIAAMRSIHTPVGWLAMALPPSALALARIFLWRRRAVTPFLTRAIV